MGFAVAGLAARSTAVCGEHRGTRRATHRMPAARPKEKNIAPTPAKTPRKQPREPHVEALRLVAAAGIAVFHTFMPWFDGLTGGFGYGAQVAPNHATTAILGFINLLGAYGNNVFFFISGLFLIPAAARAASEARTSGGAYWGSQMRKTARRAASLLATVALWCGLAWAANRWVCPIEGLEPGETAWFTGGLEFIWVYLAFTLLAPAIGWVWCRAKRPAAMVACLCAAVFAVNAYIAFFSQGDDVRELLDWRKLMSAATYLCAFTCGGAMAGVRLERRRATGALAGCVAVAAAVEAVCSHTGALTLMAATSFKSTSVLSFAMAAASVLYARSVAGAGSKDAKKTELTAVEPPTPERSSRTAAFVTRCAKSILGFYILQSILAGLWQPVFIELTVEAFLAYNSWVVLALGCALSLGLLAALIAVDQLVRIPLFERLGLA